MTSGWWQRALNAVFFMLLATLPTQTLVSAQETSSAAWQIARSDGVRTVQPCDETIGQSAAKDAMRLLCLRNAPTNDGVTVRSAIVVGFVGGFVSHDDLRRPEVQFAEFLRERYPSAVRVAVFANRDGRKARLWLLHQLDVNGDGILTYAEKEHATIIIYGHSWGGSQTVTLARQLDRLGIQIRLTVQVDSVEKPWQSDSRIPDNVVRAINFYQSEGVLLHGRSAIRAADPDQTIILGNFRMSYRRHSINCDNYPWLVRVLSRPHHEIENDPDVWNQVGLLIDSEISSTKSAAASSWASGVLPPE